MSQQEIIWHFTGCLKCLENGCPLGCNYISHLCLNNFGIHLTESSTLDILAVVLQKAISQAPIIVFKHESLAKHTFKGRIVLNTMPAIILESLLPISHFAFFSLHNLSCAKGILSQRENIFMCCMNMHEIILSLFVYSEMWM